MKWAGSVGKAWIAVPFLRLNTNRKQLYEERVHEGTQSSHEGRHGGGMRPMITFYQHTEAGM